MAGLISGAGHPSSITPGLINPIHYSTDVLIRNTEKSMVQHIAKAVGDMKANSLTAGQTVRWPTYDPEVNLWKKAQNNEDPDLSTFNLCSVDAKICGHNKFRVKLSIDDHKSMQDHGLDSIYITALDKTVSAGLHCSWDNGHLATMISGAHRDNTGNDAQGSANLGSPDAPIQLSADRAERADQLAELYANLQMVMQLNNVDIDDLTMVMPTQVASASLSIFTGENMCCADGNPLVSGRMPNTIYGMDTFRTNRRVLKLRHAGKDLYMIIVADKSASGFVSDMYGYEWVKHMGDHFLLGNTVYGSFVTQPEQIAVAVVTF